MKTADRRIKPLSELQPGNYTIQDIIINEKCETPERDFIFRAKLFGISRGNTVTVIKKNRSAVIIQNSFGRFAIGNGLAKLILAIN